MNLDDLRVSAAFNRDEVWPLIGPMVGGGAYIPVEGVNDAVALNMDVFAGIDALQVTPDGITGLSMRVQESDKDWGTVTFTVRTEAGSYDTQLSKARRQWADRRLMRPGWIIHTYVHKVTNSILAIHAVDWYAAINHIQEYPSRCPEKENSTTTALFRYASVTDPLIARFVRTYRPSGVPA